MPSRSPGAAISERQGSNDYRIPEVAAGAVALVLPLLFTTSFTQASWAPRYLALPVLATAGVILIPRLLVGRLRLAARLALGFFGWAGLTTVTAPDRTVAIWGRYQVGTGLLFVAALVGAWALGAAIRPHAARLVEAALLTACVVNATLAVTQQVVRLDRFGLGLYSGRSAGLFGNPAFLAELLAGGLWLALSRWAPCTRNGVVSRLTAEGVSSPTRAGTAAQPTWGMHERAPAALVVITIAAGISVTGSRIGVALAAGAVLAAIPHLGRRRAMGGALLVALGLVLGAALAHEGFSGGGTTGVARLEVAPATGVRPRVDTWRSAVPAVAHRPVLGWGPSGFLAATSPRRTLAIARLEGPDQLFADAHDFVVEYAVTTGVPGLALVLAWLVAAVGAVGTRRTESAIPLVGFGLSVLAVSLLEPLHVGTTPVAMLALGAAAASGDPAATSSRTSGILRAGGRALCAVVVTAGVTVSAVIGLGLLRLRQAELRASPRAAARATLLLPRWAEPAAVVARQYGFRNVDGHDPVAGRTALGWLNEAARRDGADPAPWLALGDGRVGARDMGGAEVAYAHALRRNPWSAIGLRRLARVESVLGHPSVELDRRAQSLGEVPTGR